MGNLLRKCYSKDIINIQAKGAIMNIKKYLFCLIFCLFFMVSGCAIALGPPTVDLKESQRPPIFRLEQVSEQKSGSGSEEWPGFRDLLIRALNQPPASSIFTKDSSGLVLKVEISSSHESDTSRLVGLGLLSIGTLGIIPLHYHSDWPVKGDVTIYSGDGKVQGQYHVQSTGTYDIQAYPLTMFTLFGASFQGDADAKEILQRTANDIVSQIMRAVDSDYEKLAVVYRSQMRAKAEQSVVEASSRDELRIIKSDVDDIPAAKSKLNNNKSYAIVIGIERYRQKLPGADFATHDAQTVTDYLTKVLGYPEENVITLLNDRALKSDFEKYFEKWLVNNVEKESTVFVYYSGHGAPDPRTGSAYLVPYDGDPSFIDQTGYSLKRMYEALGRLQTREIIVVLDSCFSGAGGKSVIAKGARPLVMNLEQDIKLSKNMTVMSASSGDQISSTYDEKGHGLFTYFMLKGIKNEDFVKQDGSLDINELHSYIKPQVERIARKQYNNEQTPQLIGGKKN